MMFQLVVILKAISKVILNSFVSCSSIFFFLPLKEAGKSDFILGGPCVPPSLHRKENIQSKEIVQKAWPFIIGWELLTYSIMFPFAEIAMTNL